MLTNLVQAHTKKFSCFSIKKYDVTVFAVTVTRLLMRLGKQAVGSVLGYEPICSKISPKLGAFSIKMSLIRPIQIVLLRQCYISTVYTQVFNVCTVCLTL